MLHNTGSGRVSTSTKRSAHEVYPQQKAHLLADRVPHVALCWTTPPSPVRLPSLREPVANRLPMGSESQKAALPVVWDPSAVGAIMAARCLDPSRIHSLSIHYEDYDGTLPRFSFV